MLTMSWVQSEVPHKLDLLAYTCNPRTGEIERGGSEIQRQPLVHSKFVAILSYMRMLS